MKIVRRPRLVLSVAAAALAATAVSGCTYINDTQTHDFYQAADGVNVNPTGLGVRNAVLVADGKGGGSLATTVVNDTDQDATVTLTGTYQDAPVFRTDVRVPAQSTVAVGSQGEQQVSATDLGAKAGDMIELHVSAPGQADASSPLPVVDRSLGYYSGVGPSDGGR